MSENDPRAFEEYTTHKTSFQLRIPVQIVTNELYQWIVEEKNDKNPLIPIKKYAELTITFAKNKPEFFAGKKAQEMLLELKTLIGEIADTTTNKKEMTKDIVPMGNYQKPSFLQMPNTKLSNYLFDTNYDLTRQVALVVSGEKDNQVTVKTQLFLSLLEDEGIEIPQKITAYDRAVHDGVCTILANSETMTATNRQIYEVITGKPTKSKKISPQALGHITRSLNKLNRTKIHFDYTQQAQARGIKCDKMTFKGYLLDFQEVEVIYNKTQSVSGYKFLTPPILYKYASDMGQIISVNKDLLNTPSVSNTEDSTVLKHYLLRRIEVMRNNKNNMESNKILFETMFNYCNIHGNREKLRSKREIVFLLLKDWKDVGYIYDFNDYKGLKNKVLGIEIFLDKPKRKNI